MNKLDIKFFQIDRSQMEGLCCKQDTAYSVNHMCACKRNGGICTTDICARRNTRDYLFQTNIFENFNLKEQSRTYRQIEVTVVKIVSTFILLRIKLSAPVSSPTQAIKTTLPFPRKQCLPYPFCSFPQFQTFLTPVSVFFSIKLRHNYK